MSRNNATLSISSQQLYKLAAGTNRTSAVKAGFYDGRFASRTEPTKKHKLHLKLRRSKPGLE